MKVRVALAVVMAASLLGTAPARAEFYDLERAVSVALNVSTSVGISREQLGTARSDILLSYSSWLPNLNMSMSTAHSFTGPSSS